MKLTFLLYITDIHWCAHYELIGVCCELHCMNSCTDVEHFTTSWLVLSRPLWPHCHSVQGHNVLQDAPVFSLNNEDVCVFHIFFLIFCVPLTLGIVSGMLCVNLF